MGWEAFYDNAPGYAIDCPACGPHGHDKCDSPEHPCGCGARLKEHVGGRCPLKVSDSYLEARGQINWLQVAT